MGSNVDLYITSTPYHMLLSCSMSKKEDMLVVFGKQKMPEYLELMVENYFGNRRVQGMSLGDYKTDIIQLPLFKFNMRRLYKQICSISTQLRNVVLFSDLNPETQWLINKIHFSGQVVIIEEGIGLYRKVHKQHENLFQLFGRVACGKEFENLEQIGTFSKVNKIICRFPEKLSDMQKIKEIETIKSIDFKGIREKLGISDINGVNWFLGQPIVEDGVLSENQYLSIILKLSDKKKNLIIKPHPRENLEKYTKLTNVEVITSKEIPMELFLDNNKEYWLYSLYSSAIIGAARYGKVFALYKLSDIQLSPEIESIFKESDVRIVANWSEVE